jgi:hypothetical protein
MNKWASDLQLSSNDTVVNDYGISDDRILECSGYTSTDTDATVLGCIFDGGHDTTDYHDDVMLNFFDIHSKISESSTVNSTTSPSDSVTTTAPTVATMTPQPTLEPSQVRDYE